MDNVIDIKKISFVKRPIALSPDYRPFYKIAQIVMVLKVNSVNQKASLLKFHLFSWALKDKENKTRLLEYLDSDFQSGLNVFGIEPSLNRALSFAISEDLISFEEGKYKLAEKGNQFYIAIEKDKDLLIEEKAYLQIIKKRLSEAQVEKLRKSWINA